MKYSIRFSLLLIMCFSASAIMAQEQVWKGDSWNCRIAGNGTLQEVSFSDGTKVDFFTSETNCGPSFYVYEDGRNSVLTWTPSGVRGYTAEYGDVRCAMSYKEWKGLPAFEVTVRNEGSEAFTPEKAGIKLGVDTYMESYPSWLDKYFPTLMMCEKDHFYGYLQSPSGHILGIVSPDPVASWSVDYNLGYYINDVNWFYGHRIESLNIDLMNTLPLPDHNPQDLWQLLPGESKTWTVALTPVASLESYAETMAAIADIPMIDSERTSFAPEETAEFKVYADKPEISVSDSVGNPVPLKVKKNGDGVFSVRTSLPSSGLYRIDVKDRTGYTSTGYISVHPEWRWCLERAREASLRCRQRATSHVETWYGFYSAFLAARHFPDETIDKAMRERYDLVSNMIYDPATAQPRQYIDRIQNTSGTIGILVDKYEAFGDITDLETASRMADWLISYSQAENGAYMNENTVYTSVIYLAKSILELTLAEREAGKADKVWIERAERHYQSAKRAVDQLVAAQGDFETEGELTFEDGMISCSALQIGMLALMQEDEADRKHYTQAMLKLLDTHDCLTQLYVPDARRRGGTLRFWEAQYDVLLLKNLFCSPHGWSGWRAYATYYAYLLTGEERWLNETFNAMGSFANLIEPGTGRLRWAFAVDPYIRGKKVCAPGGPAELADSLSFGNPHPELYEHKEFIGGEQYIDMISDWQTINTQDNDVHELFKCMGEAVLTNAFVIENEDGTVKGYNCSVLNEGEILTVTASEEQIMNLHLNLRKPHKVMFGGRTFTAEPGLGFMP